MSESLAPSPASGARGSERWLRGLSDALDPAVCGGKAAGLARLLQAGFPVPDGICLTTDCFHAALHATDVAARVDVLAADATVDPQARRDRLAEIRRLVEAVPLPVPLAETIECAMKSLRRRWNGMLAVRSSALLEDHADASHAGIHATFVGQYAADAVVARIKACWASLWTERAWAYRERAGIPHANAAMAVVIQRFVAGGRAGVAFSADPMSADPATVVIEAAWGTGEAVVAGALTPDHYGVTVSGGMPPLVRSERSSPRPVLSDAEVRTLARLVKRVERALGVAADVEWAYDGRTFWVVQGRPMHRGEARRDHTMWTRANLKEVFPDQPSPLALSYLSVALNGMSREYHSAQGYGEPARARLVGVFRGRPYLNLTLMDQMTVARGGKPEVAWRLFGGATPLQRRPNPAAFRPQAGPGSGLRLARELLTTVFLTPRRAERLFRTMRWQAQSYATVPLERLDDAALKAHLIRFAGTLLHAARLRRLHEIVSAQSRAYIILERLLSAWIPAKAERLLTELMTGLGTLPNARLTYRLMALSAMARAEPGVVAFLGSARDRETLRGYRSALAGSRFVAEFDGLLREFGHRGPFESDVMSPRFADDPEPLLRVIETYLRMPVEDPDRHEADRRRIREAAQSETRLSLRSGRPWSTFAVQWLVLSVVCAALQRLVAHRDENRHVTTMLVAHLRQIALEIGRRAARDGRLAAPDDVFFVLWDELPALLVDPDRDWRPLVAGRRRERARHATTPAPDLLCGEEPAEDGPDAADSIARDTLTGFGVSPGTVTGTVKLIRSATDLRALAGEIAVLPAIEPSLASIFPVVSGLVAEIGGVLSHAAILAREYGLPAVVNVKNVTRHLHDGDRVELNGTTGRIRLLGRQPGASVAVPHDQRGDREPDQRAGHDV